MNWIDVRRRIDEGEGGTPEFKRGFDLSEIGPAVCAFANSEGGLIILGVDNNREVAGVRRDPEDVQERLASFLQNGCNTPVAADIGRHNERDRNGDIDRWVHWIVVPKQRGLEPVSYRDRVFVRRGRSSVIPSPSELQDLFNSFGCILTEERAIQSSSASQIDMQKFRAYLGNRGIEAGEDPQPGDEIDLRNAAALMESGQGLRPTLYGVLAFGKEPQRYAQTRNFLVRCAAYDGIDRAAEALQVAEAKGCVDEQVDRAVGWFKGLGRFESYVGLKRKDRPLLPERAVREALVNSVVHRDYAITGSEVLFEVFADRVDVTSPGSLPNGLSIDSVRSGFLVRARNQSLAHFMSEMGYMEHRGRGWPLMAKHMREFNGSEPGLIFDRESRCVRVTFRFKAPE